MVKNNTIKQPKADKTNSAKKPDQSKKASSFKTKLVDKAIRKLYSKSAPMLICEAILFAAAAVLIFFKPVAILATLTFIFGGILVLFGLYQTVAGFFGDKEDVSGKALAIVFGIVNILLGVLFVANPVSSMVTVVFIFAILFLIKAIKSLLLSIEMARAKFGNYKMDIFLSIILIILSILMMVFPIAGAVTTMYFIAVMLLVYAISDVHMYYELRRLKKKLLGE